MRSGNISITYLSARVRQLAPLLLVLFSAAAAVAAYLQALNYPFVSDDNVYVTENTKLAGLHLTELWRLFVEPYNSFSEFLPLRDLSYWFDMTLFGMTPSAFRLHNILLYPLCLPLLYATTLGLWRYFRSADAASAPWAAAAVTALFAVHPAHVEAVVWVAGRKDVLCGMFSLLALWLAVNARREQRLSPAYAATALLALLAAMLSKATAVAVAPVIALLWVFFWRDIPAPARRRSLLLWPLASLLLVACASLVFATTIKSIIPFYFGIETVTRTLSILGWLARLSVSPENHHFYYPVFEDTWLPTMVTLGGVVLAAIVFGGVMFLRRRSLEGFALFAFLLLCMPYLQLIPYRPPSLISDRFLFLAVWPAALLLVALAWRLKPLPRAILLLAIALPWGFQTVERPRDWQSFDSLMDSDLRAFPGYYMPALYKINHQKIGPETYGEIFKIAGNISDPAARDIILKLIQSDYAIYVDAASTGNPREAMILLQNMEPNLKQPPAQAKWNTPRHNLWHTCQVMYTNQWKTLVENFPDDALVRYNAELWMLNVPEYKDTITYLRAAVESEHLPESVRGTAFKNLGLALINSGHIAEAEDPLLAALEQQPPDLRAYCLLSKVYSQTGRSEEAARAEAECRNRAPSKETAQ